MIGHDAVTGDTLAAVRSFSEAFARRDVNAVMERMTPDCIFEHAIPAPDGGRFVGQTAVRAAFIDFFATNPNASFEVEETLVTDNRVITRWTRTAPTRMRGVDIYRVQDGRVAEKLSYSKRPG